MKASIFKPCACKACVAECSRTPGWFTPEEARAAIDAGYAHRMMCVTQYGQRIHGERGVITADLVSVTALAPAIEGKEGREVHSQLGRCTFLLKDGRCEIHDSGFKPAECRTNYGCRESPPGAITETQMFPLWSTPEGIGTVSLWRVAVSKHDVIMGG